MQLVKITNLRSKPLVLNGNERVTIKPRSHAIIPFAQAAGWFGDPRTVNKGREKTRSDVFRQVQQLWGYVEGVQYVDDDGNLLTWDDLKPKIEAEDMDGNPIVFVMDDPLGENAMSGEIIDPSAQSTSQLQAQVESLTQQLAQLTALMEQTATAQATQSEQLEALTASATDIPKADPSTAGAAEDTPRTTRVGGKAK